MSVLCILGRRLLRWIPENSAHENEAPPLQYAAFDSCPLTATASRCYAGGMVFSRERILDALARLPFIVAGELALS